MAKIAPETGVSIYDALINDLFALESHLKSENQLDKAHVANRAVQVIRILENELSNTENVQGGEM